MIGEGLNRYIYRNIRKHSTTESVYKKIYLFSSLIIQKVFSSDQLFIYSILILISVLLFFGIATNLSMMTLLFGLSVAALWFKTKNLVLSLYLISIFSLQFYRPSKYYMIEVIHSNELTKIPDFTGYQLGFGLNLYNILIYSGIFAALREIINQKRVRSYLKIFKPFKPVIICALCFFVITLFMAAYFSPLRELSFVWCFQYIQAFLVAFLTFYIYINYPKKFVLIFPVILSLICFQSVLSILQFLHQGTIGLPIESEPKRLIPSYGLDENGIMFRVPGSLMFHNQLALILLIALVIITPHILKKRNLTYFTGSLLAIITIIITQSRSAWIAAFVAAAMIIKTYKKNIRLLFMFIGRTRIRLYAVLLLLCLSFVLLPRIYLSRNTFNESAGIPLRIRLFDEGLELLKNRPWFGFGLGTNETMLYDFFPDGIVSEYPAPVHVALLQLALESGLVGLFLFLFPFLYVGKKILEMRFNSGSGNIKDYHFIFMAGCAVFFTYYLFLPHVGIVEFTYAGIILGFGMITMYHADKSKI